MESLTARSETSSDAGSWSEEPEIGGEENVEDCAAAVAAWIEEAFRCFHAGVFPEAEASFCEAIALLTDPLADLSGAYDEIGRALELSSAYFNLGLVLDAVGRQNDACIAYVTARRVLEPLIERGETHLNWDLAQLCITIANTRVGTRHETLAVEDLLTAIQLLESEIPPQREQADPSRTPEVLESLCKACVSLSAIVRDHPEIDAPNGRQLLEKAMQAQTLLEHWGFSQNPAARKALEHQHAGWAREENYVRDNALLDLYDIPAFTQSLPELHVDTDADADAENPTQRDGGCRDMIEDLAFLSGDGKNENAVAALAWDALHPQTSRRNPHAKSARGADRGVILVGMGYTDVEEDDV